jgi:hypothetical protein
MMGAKNGFLDNTYTADTPRKCGVKLLASCRLYRHSSDRCDVAKPLLMYASQEAIQSKRGRKTSHYPARLQSVGIR